VVGFQTTGKESGRLLEVEDIANIAAQGNTNDWKNVVPRSKFGVVEDLKSGVQESNLGLQQVNFGMGNL
jgi:hypothetical protein